MKIFKVHYYPYMIFTAANEWKSTIVRQYVHSDVMKLKQRNLHIA